MSFKVQYGPNLSEYGAAIANAASAAASREEAARQIGMNQEFWGAQIQREGNLMDEYKAWLLHQADLQRGYWEYQAALASVNGPEALARAGLLKEQAASTKSATKRNDDAYRLAKGAAYETARAPNTASFVPSTIVGHYQKPVGPSNNMMKLALGG